MNRMTPQQISDKVKERFSAAVKEVKIDGVVNPFLAITPEGLRDVCQLLRDDAELRFDFLMCLSGMDLGKATLGVVYHCASTVHKHTIVLKVSVPAEKPEVPSVADIWPTANWHEREAYDMFGLQFSGHPDLRRILMPEDWPGHPLRKDFKVPEFYHGMKVPY
jgi:NADH-quinone oxidoreductase subunit C